MATYPDRSSPSSGPALNVARTLIREAAQHPWLAALLMRRRPDWLTRLAHWAQHLRRLPRHTRRTLWRKLASGLAAAALLLALSGPPQVVRADSTIVVNGDGTGGTCSLAAAVLNANNDNQSGSVNCAAGSGADTIDLQTDVTLPGMLNMITSEIIIEGNGHTIDGNHAYRVLGVRFDGNLTLKNAIITHGLYPDGAGISNAGTLNVQDSLITANTADYSGYGGNGGGIDNSGNLTVTNSTISNNTAAAGSYGGYGGGLYLSGTGTVTITNSTLSNNTAGLAGGGVALVSSSTVHIVNSTLSGNMAENGGGIYASIGDLTIQNNTITNNTANSYGGGIWALDAAATLTLERSIVSGNTATDGFEVYATPGIGGVYANAVNLFGNSSEADAEAFYGFTPGASDIVATGDGGGTPTALTDILDTALAQNGSQPHPDTHALVSGSPAIDQIAKATCDAAPVNGVDERGGARANGAGLGGAACDIGAYEFDSTQTPTAVTLRDLTATANSSPRDVSVLGAALAALAALGALLIGRRVKAKARP